MENTKISPSMSFKGWNVKEWIKGNKEAIKIIVGAVVAISALYPALAVYFAAGGIGALIIKLILDIVDFYGSEVKLS